MRWEGKLVELYEEWWEVQTVDELPFWTQVALQCAKEQIGGVETFRIVELCSGTGRILVPVVQHLRENLPSLNIDAVGVDFSAEMCDRLRVRASSCGLASQIRPMLADICTPEWTMALTKPGANLILIPFNHFALLGSSVLQNQLLKRISELLRPGGHFVVADYHPEYRRKLDDGQKRFRRMIVNSEARRVLYYWTKSWPGNLEHTTANVIYGLDVVEWDEKSGGELRISPIQAVMMANYVAPDEWKRLLANVGFKLIAEFGDYHFQPLSSESRSYVFVATKPGTS